MSGHNKWSQIKHQKSASDKKKSVVFSKVLNAITIAARDEANPQFNPRLRTLIEKAKENNIPQDNIERAIKKTKESDNLKEITVEAYGPGGSALIIDAITDNSNRTINELKFLLNENEAKMAEQGSVRWAFEGDKAKFPQEVSQEDREKIQKLIEIIEENNDVQKVLTNLKE